MNATHPETAERTDHVGRLLRDIGCPGPFTLTPLQGGANSRAFRLDLDHGSALFYKEYFQHADDPRDRLGTEYSFATFAWKRGVQTIAQPYGKDRGGRGAVYAFLDGRKLTPREVTADAIGQCVDFIAQLNAHKDTPEALRLPTASEACFCLTDHWRCVQRRVQRLDAIEPAGDIDRQAQAFVHGELAPACAAYLGSAQDVARAAGLSPHALIPPNDLVLSPSDFGFHNALLGDDGALRFLDFEYAGWDDPAKLVCDFFCQPACPVPLEYYESFASRIAASTSDPRMHRMRMDLLLPAYRLKWCCILLNDFLPGDGKRRRFALDGRDEHGRKAEQLHKVRQALGQYWNEEPASVAA